MIYTEGGNTDTSKTEVQIYDIYLVRSIHTMGVQIYDIYRAGKTYIYLSGGYRYMIYTERGRHIGEDTDM